MQQSHRQAILNRLNRSALQLSAGDLERLAQFAEALVEQKAGKRQQRARRVEKPVVTFAVLGD